MTREQLRAQLATFGAVKAAGMPPEAAAEWETEMKRIAGWGGGGV